MVWKRGCQPFSCLCSQNVTHFRKDICGTCFLQESIPATPFGNFNHPLPARSRCLIAAARSTTSALWLHHAHPFVAAAGRNLSHAEKQRVWCCQPFSCRCSQNVTIAERRFVRHVCLRNPFPLLFFAKTFNS